jgi:hypothetical protein
MNHIRQRNHLEIQLKNFKDYVPLCPNDSLPKLLQEITKIQNRLEKIREFTIDQLLQDVTVVEDTKQSKINFRTI